MMILMGSAVTVVNYSVKNACGCAVMNANSSMILKHQKLSRENIPEHFICNWSFESMQKFKILILEKCIYTLVHFLTKTVSQHLHCPIIVLEKCIFRGSH